MDKTCEFLRFIRASPDSDTARLVLADFIQEQGFDGAAAYMRESIAHANGMARGPRRRNARDYIRWLRAMLDVPEDVPELDYNNFINGGETWDSFVWTADFKRGHRCTLSVERGLPASVATTLPLFMARTADTFLFPLTKVKITERAPYRDDMTGDVIFGWVCSPHPSRFRTWEDYADNIPAPLWEHLAPSGGVGQSYHSRGHYLSAIAARSDLNAAALLFGRAAVA